MATKPIDAITDEAHRIDRIAARLIRFHAMKAPAFVYVNEANLLLKMFGKRAAKDADRVKAFKVKLRKNRK